MSALLNISDIYAFLKKQPKLIFADDFELAVQSEKTLKTSFSKGLLAKQEKEDTFWVGLRLMHRKRPGLAVTSDTTPAGLRFLVEQALLSAENSSQDPWFRLPLWKKMPASGVPEEAVVPQPLSFTNTDLEEIHSYRALHTLLGRKNEKFELESHQSGYGSSLSLKNSEGAFDEHWSSLRAPTNTKERLENLLNQSQVEKQFIEKKVAPLEEARGIILVGQAARDWVLSLGRALTASESGLDKNGSYSQALTLWDDGLSEFTPFRSAFDLEGVVTQKTLLIERGQYKSFLHNNYTACQDNRVSTGNVFRNTYERFSSIEPWRLVLEASENTEPWKGKGPIAYIDRISLPERAGRTTQNALSWDRCVQGFLFHRGEPVTRLEPTRVQWDYNTMAKALTAVDNRVRDFGSVVTPSLWWEETPAMS